MNKRSMRDVLLASVGLAFGLSGIAYAQDAQSADEEIIVTAQKRSEHLQDVPIQVDVISADDLADRQIRQTADIVRTVPNLSIQRTDTYTNTVVTLRGISQASNSDAPVAVIVDGVPQDDAKQFNMRLLDVSQIEVLRGPQGSIYGRNAEAGAIIITTAAPTNELSGMATASYGNGNTVDLAGAVSGAIVPDRVQYRLAGSFVSSDGLIPNDTTGVDADKINHDWTLRGTLLFHLGDATQLSLIGGYSDFNAAGVIFAPVFSGDANDFQSPQSNYPNRGNGHALNLTANFETDLGFATFNSITGYSKLNQTQITDVDFTPFPFPSPPFPPGNLGIADNQPYQREIETQEFRLVSPNGGPLRWLASVDFLHSQHFRDTHLFFDMGHPETDPYDPTLVFQDNQTDEERSNYGASAQVDYDFNSAFTATVGARYDRDERTQTDTTTGVESKATFDDFQPRVSLTYRIDAHRQVYATYGVGFRSGGFNPPGFPLTRAEELTNYEIGFKTQWFDRALTLNGAVFHSDVSDFQFSYIDFTTASEVTGNIDSVKINGAELESRLRVTPEFDVFANLGYAHPEIDRLPAFPQFEGNNTPRSANLSLNAGFDYEHDLANALTFFVRADAQYSSKRYWFTDNLDVQDPKTFWNMSFGLQGESWTLSVWGRNLSDTRAYDTYYPSQSTGLPYDVAFPTRPRTYGVEFSVRY